MATHRRQPTPTPPGARVTALALAAVLATAAAAADTRGHHGHRTLAAVAPAPPSAVSRLLDAAPLANRLPELQPSALPAPAVAPPRVVPARRPVTHTAPRAAWRARGTRGRGRGRVQPWLPSGTGMWLHQWERTEGGDPWRIVARAQAEHVSVLYWRGWDPVDGGKGYQLQALLHAACRTGIRVVAWQFPSLRMAAREARLLASYSHVAWPGCPRIAAVAPDIETPAEGTHLSARAVAVYLKVLRGALPAGTSILTTVPWPSELRVGRYPYAAVAARSDAIMPMAYWYDRSPVVVTQQSLARLRGLRRPVLPVGQGYDPRLDAPYLPAFDVPVQVTQFLVAAAGAHVRSVSLWSWQTAGPGVWARLAAAARLFR